MERLRGCLSALPFWNKLKEERKQALLRGTAEQTLSRGSLLEGDYGLIQVQGGTVRSYLLSEEGREITLFHLREGEICTLGGTDLAAQLPVTPQMIVEEDCRILTVSRAAVRAAMEEVPEIRAFVFEQGSRHLVRMVWSMEQILFLHVDRRLAFFLLEEYRRTGSRDIRMTHEEIARQISSAREVVARMVKRFSAQGLVEARRGSIRLVDLEGLEKLNQ